MFKGNFNNNKIPGSGTQPVFFLLDIDGYIQHISFVSSDFTGKSPADFVEAGIPFRGIIHPEDRSLISFETDEFVQPDRMLHLKKIRVTDGESGWKKANLSIEPIEFKEGGSGYIAVLYPVETKQSLPEAKELGHGFAMQVLAQMGEGLALSDKDENFLYVNNALLEMTGYTEEELIGEHSNILVKEYHYDESARAFELRKKEKKSVYEIHLKKKNGGYIDTLITSVGFWLGDNFQGSIAIIRDITNAKKIEAELREALEKAEEASREKQKFLASMSHEIRTPMSGVLGMAQLLANTSLDKEQAEYLEAIEQSARSLTNLLNDLLAFSELESEKIELITAPFDIKKTLNNLSRTFDLRAEKKQIQFSLELDESLPEKITGDRDRYLQVLMQILANAFKFTERGSVTLRVSKRTEVNGRVWIKAEVKDTGIGMPDKLLHSIFEGFSKGDESMMTAHSGAGVGLAIVKKIIGLMDGTIDVVSKQGEGTFVTVDIPFEIAEDEKPNQPALANDKSGDPSSLQGLVILVADDHPINRRLLERMLGKVGITVMSAENGREVLDILKSSSKIDLILMDVHMPVMNGLEATRIIRTDFEKPQSQVPIIAVTASAMSSDIKACNTAGMDDFISKPFTFHELRDKITHYTSIPEQSPDSNADELVVDETHPGPVNFSVLSEMASGDEEMMLELMELFLEQTPGMIEELRIAFHDSDRIEMAGKAHTLKPTFTYMGMPEAFEIVKELEKYRDEEIRQPDKVNEQISRLEQLAEQAFREINNEANLLRK